MASSQPQIVIDDDLEYEPNLNKTAGKVSSLFIYDAPRPEASTLILTSRFNKAKMAQPVPAMPGPDSQQLDKLSDHEEGDGPLATQAEAELQGESPQSGDLDAERFLAEQLRLADVAVRKKLFAQSPQEEPAPKCRRTGKLSPSAISLNKNPGMAPDELCKDATGNGVCEESAEAPDALATGALDKNPAVASDEVKELVQGPELPPDLAENSGVTLKKKKKRRESSKAWRSKWLKKGIPRSSEGQLFVRSAPAEPEPAAAEPFDFSDSKIGSLREARDKFVAAWIAASNMPQSNDRRKAALTAWMASTMRSDLMAARAGVQK